MAIELIQGVNDTPTQGNNTVTLSNSIQDGDLAIAVHSHLHSSTLPTAPDGFELIDNQSIGSSRATLWQKELSAADAGSTITFESLNVDSSLSIVVLRGAAINVYDVFAQTSNNISSTIPAVTASVPDSIHYAFYATEGRHNPTTPAGWTLVVDSPTGTYDPNRTEIWKWDTENLPANTSSGTQSVSGSMSDGKVVWRVAFEPVAAPVNDSYDADTPTATLNALEAEVVIGTSARTDVETPNASLEAYDVSVDVEVSVALDVDTAAVTLASDVAEAGSNISTDLSTPTLFTDAYNPTLETKYVHELVLEPTDDYWVSGGAEIRDEALRAQAPGTTATLIFPELPDNANIEFIGFSFTVIVSSGSGGNIVVMGHEGELASIPVAVSWDPQTVDITSLVDPEDFAGLGLSPRYDGRLDIASSRHENVEYRPSLVVQYTAIPDTTIEVASPDFTVRAEEAVVETVNPVHVSVDLSDTPELFFEANDVTTEGSALVNIETAAITFNAEEPEVEAVISPDVTVEPQTASIWLAEPSAEVVLDLVVEVSDTSTVMLGAYDADVELNNSAVSEVDTPKILLTHIRVSDVNGEPVLPSETEDPYFKATMNTLTGWSPGVSGGTLDQARGSTLTRQFQQWFRMNETSGNVAYDRAYEIDSRGDIVGQARLRLHDVSVGLNDGPEGRSYFHFNGAAYAEEENAAQPRGESVQGLEFTFRTTKKTQFIMGNADFGNTGLWQTPAITWELWMVDGKLEVRTGTWKNIPGTRESALEIKTTTGRKDLADGEWHHVVLQTGHYSTLDHRVTGSTSPWAFELIIDGQLDLRRREGAAVLGFPDVIGGRDSGYYQVENSFGGAAAALSDLAVDQWFHGDLTELVWRQGRALSPDEVAMQRDAIFGINAVWTAGAKLRVRAHEASAKGNKPRLLVLHFGASNDHETRRASFSLEPNALMVGEGEPTLTGYSRSNPRSVDLTFVGLGDHVLPYNFTSKDAWPDENLLVTHHYVLSPSRFDEVTDNHRILDLDLDLNMDEFDIISIAGFPHNDWEMRGYDLLDSLNAPPYTPGRQQLLNLLEQIKEQVIVHGKGLFVADPFSAVLLGIVDQVDVVPEYNEHAPQGYSDNRLGANNPGFDSHAFATDPFGGGQSDGDPSIRPGSAAARVAAASRYADTHGNHRQRVRALVPGLTDQPGWIRKDVIWWVNVNPMNNPPDQVSVKYENKPFGLSVGDEFYMDSPQTQAGFSYNAATSLVSTRYVWKHTGHRLAAPISAIKVGTAVTSYPLFIHIGRQEATMVGEPYPASDAKGNPFHDHAISIAIQPGDIWDGRNVRGKVYVNFTESMQMFAMHKHIAQRHAWEHLAADDGIQGRLSIFDDINVGGGRRMTITPLMASYQYSTHYGAWSGTEINWSQPKRPDWGWSAGGVRGSGLSGQGGQAMNWVWKSAGALVDIHVPTMSERGLNWLLRDIDIEGNASVYPQSARVSAQAMDVEVETSKVEVVDVSTARMQVEAYKDMDSPDSDVSVLVQTATVRLNAHTPATVFEASTATVALTTNELEREQIKIDWTEVIMLTLPRQIETLILEVN